MRMAQRVTEEDVLHATHLPTFAGQLSDEDAEQLSAGRVPMLLERIADHRVGMATCVRVPVRGRRGGRGREHGRRRDGAGRVRARQRARRVCRRVDAQRRLSARAAS